MKKQVLALSCAIALGSGAALSPATGPAVEPTAQIGYGIAKMAQANDWWQVGSSAAGGVVGGKVGEILGGSTYTVTQLPRISARAAVSIGIRIGARVGMFGGFVGLAVGTVAGAL